MALFAVGVALGFGELIQQLVGVGNVDLVFLTAIVAVAVRWVFCRRCWRACASAIAYNFFFLPPIYTLTIGDPANIVAFGLFTLVAVIVSSVAARGRTQAMRQPIAPESRSFCIRSAASLPEPARSTMSFGRRRIRQR